MSAYIRDLFLTLSGCDKGRLSDQGFLYGMLAQSPQELSMQTCIPPRVFNSGETLFGAVGLMTSHLAVATKPSKNVAFVSLSSCGEFDPEKATRYFSGAFSPSSYGRLFKQCKIPGREWEVVLDDYHADRTPRVDREYKDHPTHSSDMGRTIRETLPIKTGGRRVDADISTFKFDPHGETAIAVLPESLVFRHTWPEHGFSHAQICYLNLPVSEGEQISVERVLQQWFDRSAQGITAVA
ncbi:MAG: S-adenosylmethionine decarboxylase [Candidatus Aenigmarchaeota archaeon]|nr:S-adenosylmethionine decarboxylase [Candidatus Aenigmarchaeota archaeon]